MKRILVAGGAGFLGSHLCDRLVGRGDTVICLDNLHTGRKTNISHLTSGMAAAQRRFRFLEHDVTKPLNWRGPLDEIYNLACPASPPHYQSDPHHTVMTCVLGVSNLLDLARRKGARLLQASTSEVYGDPLSEVQTETDLGNVNCIGPRACYDEGKRCAESLLFDAWRQHRQAIKVARIFNTYGPRMREDDGRIISNFVVQAIQGLPLTIYGDGSQTRSFCYVDDLVDGLVRLMETPGEVTGPINLGNPVEMRVCDVARHIAVKLGIEFRPQYRPLPADDPRRRRPNIARARALLGWKPLTNFEIGLDRTIAYFQARLTPAAGLAASAETFRRRAPDLVINAGNA